MTTLAQYLEARQAEAITRMEATPGLCIFYPTTSLAHWAEIGITTVEEFELYEAQATYSDLFKEVYGGRPRGMMPQTLEELEAGIESLQESLRLQIEIEEEYLEEMEERELQYAAEFAEAQIELAEYREAQVWANYQDGWI